MATDFEQNAAFYDALAPHYDGHLSGNPYDALARTAFRDLVVRHVGAGSILLDFGCGTGMDALYYARQGYRVLAYDNSQGMVTALERRCQTEIASGTIKARALPYPEFLKQAADWPSPHAVAANFAVFNSIRDLAPLFEMLARCLAPPGWIFASVLNPIHWSRIKAPGWWRNLLRARGKPPVYFTQPYTSYLHFVPALLRVAPAFHLAGRANAGALVRYDASRRRSGTSLWWAEESVRVGAWSRIFWHTSAHKLLGHFVFLVLRRDS